MIKALVFEIETIFYDGDILYDDMGKPHNNIPYVNAQMVGRLKGEGYIVIGVAKKTTDIYLNNLFSSVYVIECSQKNVLEKIQKDFSIKENELCYVCTKNIPQLINNEKTELVIYQANPKEKRFWNDLESYLGIQSKRTPLRDKSKAYQLIKKFLKTAMPPTVEQRVTGQIRNLRNIRKPYYKTRKKQYTSFGEENPGIFFYLIRISYQPMGPFSCWFHYLDQIEYALSKGYHPVIDLKTYYMQLWQDIKEKGKVNAWETYFEQPLNDDLEDVYRSKNVILSWEVGCSPTAPDWNQPISSNMDRFDKYFIIVEKYMRFNEEMKKYIKKIHDGIFPRTGKILGVGYRRGYIFSYLKNNPIITNHPRQPDMDNLITDIEKYMKEWGCDYVFASVDDHECVDILKKRFQEKLIVMERIRSHYFKDNKPVESVTEIKLEYLAQETDSVYISNRDYFTEVALLSKCHCLFSGISSATQVAILYNNKRYEHVYLYEDGSYVI